MEEICIDVIDNTVIHFHQFNPGFVAVLSTAMKLKQKGQTKEMIIYLLMYLIYFVCLFEYYRDQVRVIPAYSPTFKVSRTKIQPYDPKRYVV